MYLDKLRQTEIPAILDHSRSVLSIRVLNKEWEGGVFQTPSRIHLIRIYCSTIAGFYILNSVFPVNRLVSWKYSIIFDPYEDTDSRSNHLNGSTWWQKWRQDQEQLHRWVNTALAASHPKSHCAIQSMFLWYEAISLEQSNFKVFQIPARRDPNDINTPVPWQNDSAMHIRGSVRRA